MSTWFFIISSSLTPHLLECIPHQDETFSFPYHALTNKHFVYDLIYNPKQLSFLRKSMEKKAFIKNGYDMLIHQAEKAWEIWNLSND